MARGDDPRGDSFDDQYHGSRRRAQYKQARGEGIWADDAALRRAGQPKPSHAKKESCLKKSVLLLAFLSGFGWIFSEIVSRAA